MGLSFNTDDFTDLPPSSQKPEKGNTKLNKVWQYCFFRCCPSLLCNIAVRHSVSLFNQKRPEVKGRVEQPNKAVKLAPAPKRLHAAGRRSKRTAAISTKSYKEPDTDDSLSELEKPAVPKAKYFTLSHVLILFFNHQKNVSTFVKKNNNYFSNCVSTCPRD